MLNYNYDRLSGQDHSFLLMETPNLQMHVAATQIYELGPLATSQGGVDFEQIKRFVASVLHRIPRYRQKLKWIPGEKKPVWVDDAQFSIDFHLRHTALPKPGSEAQLKRLASRVMAQQLDRSRPLWEIWVVEGLDNDRFALISKIHHCMIDGSSGVDISQILQSTTPDREIADPPPFIPRREPTGAELFLDSLRWRLGLPIRALQRFRSFRREAEDLQAEIELRARALGDAFKSQLQLASKTPINGELGPQRSFEWMSLPLEHVKGVRKALGCTINDVVLAVVTNAVREYMIRRQVSPGSVDFRVSAPVSVRREEERGKLGNRVSNWVVKLPLEKDNPLRQLEAIQTLTQGFKASNQALGVDMIMSLLGVMPTGLLSLGAQAASGLVNSIVTNVPGPQIPLYLLGTELLAMYPQVPLLRNVGLGIALISYNGKMCWGFNADPNLVPDLDAFVGLVQSSFHALAAAADAEAPQKRSGGEKKPKKGQKPQLVQ